MNSVTFEQAFYSFCEATSKVKPKTATDETLKKICTDSKLYKGKFDTNSVDICFRKFMGNKTECNFHEFKAFIDGPFAGEYEKEWGNRDEIEAKIIDSSPAAEGAKVDATTARLTDTSEYTGSHEERFDESLQGEGQEGREDNNLIEGINADYGR